MSDGEVKMLGEDWLVAKAERFGALLIGVACASAVYLFLASLSDWQMDGGSLLSVLPVSGPLYLALTIAVIAAFGFCIAAMLVVVTVEARRIRRFRDSLDWVRVGSSPRVHRGGVEGADHAPVLVELDRSAERYRRSPGARTRGRGRS